MSLKIYGSLASPYARRIRIHLHELPHEFIPIDIFEEKTREEMKKVNPTLKIPYLISDGLKLFDSQLIWNHFNKTYDWHTLSLEEEKYLKVINDANDSGLILFSQKKFGIDPNFSNAFSYLQKERIEVCLEYLESHIKLSEIWNPIGTWLFCLLDWFDFRNIYSYDKLENLKKFWTANQNRKDVSKTDPRN